MTSHLEEGVLQELLDGEIPSSELPPIQAHLAGCAECRARLDEARAIGAEADRLIETIDVADAPARITPRIPAARRKAWIRNLAWAATVVIAAGSGYLARRPESRTMESKSAVTLPETEPAPIAAAAAVPGPAADQPLPPADQPAPGRSKGTASGGFSAAAPLERREAPADARRIPRRPADSAASLLNTKGLLDSGLARDRAVVTAVAEPPAAQPAALASGRGDTLRQEIALRGASSLAASPNRLDDVTVTGAAKRAAGPVEITLTEAMRRLDGSLRLIEGLVPIRLEALGRDVRVVYPLGTGELLLAQWLENGRISYKLVAPPGFPADSLDRLRARVRE